MVWLCSVTRLGCSGDERKAALPVLARTWLAVLLVLRRGTSVVDVAPCFTSETGDRADFLVHLRENMQGVGGDTLCGKKAMPSLGVRRRKITCPQCRKLKPRLLGGSLTS